MRTPGSLTSAQIRFLGTGLLVFGLAACTETPEFEDRQFVPLTNVLQGVYTVSQTELDKTEAQWGRAVVGLSSKASMYNLLRENTDEEGRVTWEATTEGMEIRVEDPRGMFKDRLRAYARGFYDDTYSVMSWLDTASLRWKLFSRQLENADASLLDGEYNCLAWNNDGAGSEGVDFFTAQYFDEQTRVDSPQAASPNGRMPQTSAYTYTVEPDGRLKLTNNDLETIRQDKENELLTQPECQAQDGGLSSDCAAYAGLFGAVALNGDLTTATRVVDTRIKETLAKGETPKAKDEWGEGGHFEICARKATGHTLSGLAGEYWIHRVDKVNGVWQGALGEMTLDDQGAGTLRTLYVSNGAATVEQSVTITLDSDGQLTVDGKPGAVTPNGKALFFDASNDLASPSTLGLVWAMRKLPPPVE